MGKIAYIMLGRWRQIWMKLLKSVHFVAEHWLSSHLVVSVFFMTWETRSWGETVRKTKCGLGSEELGKDLKYTLCIIGTKHMGWEILKSRFLAIILTWPWGHLANFSQHYDVKTCSLLGLPSPNVRSPNRKNLLLLLRPCPPIYLLFIF